MNKEYSCKIDIETATPEEQARIGRIIKWFRDKEPRDVVNVFTRSQLRMIAVYITGEEISQAESMANLANITTNVCNTLSEQQVQICLAQIQE